MMTYQSLHLQHPRMIYLLLLFLSMTWQGAKTQDFDIAGIIDIQYAEDIETVRGELVSLLFGPQGFPRDKLPDIMEKVAFDSAFSSLENLTDITRLSMDMEWGLNSIAYFFTPRTSNNQLVIYHQGHRGDFTLGKNTIQSLVESGFHVIALSMPLLGKNRKPVVQTDEFGPICISSHELISFLEPSSGHPVRYFLDPVIRAVNFAENFNFDRISMVGISGGGWTTTLCAAIDPRIHYSFPVAGSLPLYIRLKDTQAFSLGDYEQYVPEIYRVANYLELYILGSYGKNRRQVQILNEYDDCCFSGTEFSSYRDILIRKMTQLEEGSYDIVLDSSHREHKISQIMIDYIIKELTNRHS